jgi:outer membrane protein assembly factor BamB
VGKLKYLLLAALAACSTYEPPKPAPLPELDHDTPVKAAWFTSAGGSDRFTFTPAIAGGSIFTASRDGTVTRFSLRDGLSSWNVPSLQRLSGGPGSDGNLVVVANEQGEVLALDAKDGKERWKARVSSEVLAAPAVGGGVVVVRSIDNRVFAFNAADGKRRWVYQRPPASLIIRTPAGVVIDGDTAYAAFAAGKLTALALANGAVRWEATVALPKGATELERVTDVVGNPVVQGREVCAATYQGRVACYEAANGRQLWAREVSSLTGVSADSRYAFVADERGSLLAFDRTDGRSIWKQDKLANRQLSLPCPFGELLAVGDFEGYVHFLARDTGAFVARYATRGGPVRAAPIAAPGGLIVQTTDGSLQALVP